MSIDITVLGEIKVRAGEVKVQLGDRRQRLCLAILAHDLHVVEYSRLMRCLWHENELPVDPQDQIQGYVRGLRTALRATTPGGDKLIRTVRGVGYELTVAPEQVDRHRFARLKAQAEACEDKDPGTAARLAERALTQWRHATGLRGGNPLADSRLEAITSSLQQEHRSVTLLRIRAALRCGRHRQLLPDLARLSTDEYGAEDADLTGLHMLALVRAGRSHDALAVYERHQTAIDELLYGSKPTRELQVLKEKIMRGDESLTPDDKDYADYGRDEPVEPPTTRPAPGGVSFSNHQTGEHAKSFQAYEMNVHGEFEDE
ncbi:AfsR/SARP family transcriptional regulator [Paractinoplanes hotanensis]|uniref:Winged helix-turn-helix domain-containing protein n=1 Tax=Paractinoplanes hotanensis TaxID=2906497 RepID=A0ABT0Y4X4_9ACTN|nr:BTAD domain-containing putative transcriptional regulator [Actinoplanes hotanensis]MCM4081071.1 winged helix-turn-helix domain-containing protein [Actinoplanes hotanensis]